MARVLLLVMSKPYREIWAIILVIVFLEATSVLLKQQFDNFYDTLRVEFFLYLKKYPFDFFKHPVKVPLNLTGFRTRWYHAEPFPAFDHPPFVLKILSPKIEAKLQCEKRPRPLCCTHAPPSRSSPWRPLVLTVFLFGTFLGAPQAEEVVPQASTVEFIRGVLGVSKRCPVEAGMGKHNSKLTREELEELEEMTNCEFFLFE
ncbi:hypothetical protein AVEN_51228-1 [Araneus ventricosus]|uniref:Uncharacterized protein n=1 Tax=Araneus ventricosus TaxID=182803 RepID=A0A4Y2LUA4_ARAVE|nr:hypothetical protein AVEN_51228-1 [Araneus ventricosus]